MLQATLYAPIFYNTVLILVMLKCISLLIQSIYENSKTEKVKAYENNKIDKINTYLLSFFIENNKTDKIKAYLLCLFVILFFGLRPISGRYFGDTSTYAHHYLNISSEKFLTSKGEWIWNWVMISCADTGLSVNAWFTLIDFLYVGFLLWASIRIEGNKVYLIVLFFVSTFLFYSGGVNGLRIGLATSIFVLAFTYILSPHIASRVFAILLFISAFFIHKSISLPLICLLCSMFLFKRIKYSVIFWFVSIILLLLFGNFFTSILDSLGLFSFDDRVASYLTDKLSSDIFHDKGGFRWDFLLYSSMPILLGWYVTEKRKITDKPYMVMLNTYILANAFWILVMYSNFSNRFASLSWFLYPLLLFYPLIKFKLWNDQRNKTALILFASMFFTYFMYLIGK